MLIVTSMTKDFFICMNQIVKKIKINISRVYTKLSAKKSCAFFHLKKFITVLMMTFILSIDLLFLYVVSL